MWPHHDETHKGFGPKLTVTHKLGLRDLLFARAWAHHVQTVQQAAETGLQGKKEAATRRRGWGALMHAREFCQNTSLHGLQYVGEAGRNVLERLFWLLAFLSAMATASYLIHNLWSQWSEKPVQVTISTSSLPITAIPFPAITLCNMNNARRSVANGILDPSANYPGLDRERLLLEDACDNMSMPSLNRNDRDILNNSPQWDDIKSFMIKVNAPCHELLLTCRWAGEDRLCKDLFNSVLTDEGLCCVFNRVPRDKLFRNPQELPDLNITFPFPALDWFPVMTYPTNTPKEVLPWRPVGAGKHLGLTVVLDIEVAEYFCSSTASAGLKMLLHNPVESPKMSSFGLAISPGKESFVSIKPEVTRSSEDLKKVPIAKRHCYFLHERQLRFYRTYTKHNCALECEANYTLSLCGCVQYYMPKDSTTRICGKADDQCADDASSKVNLHQFNEDVEESSGSWKSSVSPSCHCLPGCNELTFTSEHTSSSLVDTFPANTKYHSNSDRSPIQNISYFTNNVIVLHFFFMDMQVMNYEKEERTGPVGFLASTGGLLGLFHGFSVLSLVEVIYYLTLRLMCSWRRHRRNSAAVVDCRDKHVPRKIRRFLP